VIERASRPRLRRSSAWHEAAGPRSPEVIFDGRVPREHIAKTVVLVDERGPALAVIPKSRRIDLPAINGEFNRCFVPQGRTQASDLRLGPSSDIPSMRRMKETETFLDLYLVTLPAVYFDTGSPRRLVRLEGEDFRALFYGAWCGRISRETDAPFGMPQRPELKAARDR
jgi:Ala-tRNA(Pro) deacylase